VGVWVNPRSGEQSNDVIAALANKVVLLGEAHDGHHRWQPTPSPHCSRGRWK
jgi:hypothetical protein